NKTQLSSTIVLQFNDELHIDFMGTLRTTHEGYKWICSMVDSGTNYMELVPLVNADAFSMTKVLLDKWIYKHGVPTTIVSDRGKQFTGAIIKHVSNVYCINLRLTTAYNPMSNAKVERPNRFIKEKFRILNIKLNEINNAIYNKWSDYLDFISFIWNITPTRATEFTPWELVKGYKPPNLVDIKKALLNEQDQVKNSSNFVNQVDYATFINNKINLLKHNYKKFNKQIAHYDKLRIAQYNKQLKKDTNVIYKPGSLVYIKNESKSGDINKFSPKYDGPWRVIKRNVNGKTYLLENVNTPSFRQNVNVRRIKHVKHDIKKSN